MFPYIYHTFHFSVKKAPLTDVYGHVGHHILHVEEKNRRRNTTQEYYPKEDKFFLYCPLYGKHLGDYTKHLGNEE